MSEPRICLVRVKSVYGRDTIYPANDAAEIIAELSGCVTLTHNALRLAERLGYSVQQAPQADNLKKFMGATAAGLAVESV